MKLSIVFPVLNQHELFYKCFEEIRKNTTTDDIEYLIIDNGSDEDIVLPGVRVIKNKENIGVYPTTNQGMDNTNGDFVAFFHSDVVIWEKGWDKRVIKEFENDINLGLIGFVGSNEIDYNGGRGCGTMSNFMGKSLDKWTGSPAEHHGRRITEGHRSAVVDGCVMILDRSAWDNIGYRKHFPPHHFYDRLICTQLLENNWNIMTLGIEFDHFNGQTSSHENKYDKFAEHWCKTHGEPVKVGSWDNTLYNRAEREWLKEYRDDKHLIPIKV